MKIAFVSNYLNHHQIPFCNDMHHLLGGDFKFISMEEMTEERKNMGWGLEKEYDYEIKAWSGEEPRNKAKQIVEESDVVIYGGSSYTSFVRSRIEANKLTFVYYERIYKNGRWRIVSPRGLYYMQRDHGRYRNKNVYLICASAYAPADFALNLAYINKSFKWGYFPKFYKHQIDELMANKINDIPHILWVARFIELKHPEYPVKMAEKLKKQGYKFKLTMIGTGEELESIKKMIKEKKLEDCIELVGSMKPTEVRDYMNKSNIFIFTSDYREGWGAVLNEAMNSGCAIVSSHAAGATPFLIRQNHSGLIYKSGNFKDFYNKVKYLIDNPEMADRFGRNAYKDIEEYWNSENAANQFLELCKGLLQGKKIYAKYGPCSKAKIISQDFMYRNIKKGDNI